MIEEDVNNNIIGDYLVVSSQLELSSVQGLLTRNAGDCWRWGAGPDNAVERPIGISKKSDLESIIAAEYYLPIKYIYDED